MFCICKSNDFKIILLLTVKPLKKYILIWLSGSNNYCRHFLENTNEGLLLPIPKSVPFTFFFFCIVCENVCASYCCWRLHHLSHTRKIVYCNSSSINIWIMRESIALILSHAADIVSPRRPIFTADGHRKGSSTSSSGFTLEQAVEYRKANQILLILVFRAWLN